MMNSMAGKTLLAATAIAGIALFAQPPAVNAASQDMCADYARDVAANHTHRGLIGGIVALPFEVTGALLTGHTSRDFEWKRVYDRAYVDCMNDRQIVYAPADEDEADVAVVVRPRTGTQAWLDYCSARHPSFDPQSGTYMTYSGQEVPCR
jgi:hypothetical protein